MFETSFVSVTEDQKQAVKNWWTAFEENQVKILESFSPDDDGAFDLPQWMQSSLQAVHAQIMWEFGPGLVKPHRLVITPEGRRELRPLIRAILQEAPVLEKFEFYGHRLPENLEMASTMLSYRAGWQDLSEIKFKTELNELNQIDITYYTPFNDPKDEQINKLWLLTAQLLGEEITERWVGFVDVRVLPKGRLFGFLKRPDIEQSPIEDFRADFDTRIAEIKASLPDQPYSEFAEEQEWVMLELEPEKQDDYDFKDDLFVAPFVSAPLFQAMHGQRNSFSAERFSSKGESFLFLKMDGAAEDLDQEIFEDRSAIEDALNDALKSMGCIIGGGTGLRYSYIDLAVTDLKAAVSIIRETLQAGKLTKRSWLFLHDPDYQSEWLGVWPDSPAPFVAAPN
ncbi:hypothetical protein [Pelagibius sp. Alg239-R121]|uniref:hypothetical protein n=1 Tax=Pelagibius sp. Alg239-R121 TaxID=2993448 RepID=UPI0024A75664|nr:hypothetical protein [Pelagibius sp. Alg239-R121]